MDHELERLDKGLKLVYKSLNLGRVEEGKKLGGRRARWYFGNVHGSITAVVQAPGGCRLAGADLCRF